jgi:drug/metabolite transporter (DMT)-like permease
MALGLTTGKVAIVAVLSSLCSTITAVLGFVLLKERLARRQWAGIALILVGVALINLR